MNNFHIAVIHSLFFFSLTSHKISDFGTFDRLCMIKSGNKNKKIAYSLWFLQKCEGSQQLEKCIKVIFESLPESHQALFSHNTSTVLVETNTTDFDNKFFTTNKALV